MLPKIYIHKLYWDHLNQGNIHLTHYPNFRYRPWPNDNGTKIYNFTTYWLEFGVLIWGLYHLSLMDVNILTNDKMLWVIITTNLA